jgi:hypothetical protein
MRAEYLASVFTLHSFDFENEEILVPCRGGRSGHAVSNKETLIRGYS